MEFIQKIVSELIVYITAFISYSGYFGVFILMALESTMVPLPSELVMPFAGYLAFQGEFNLFAICIVSAFGTVFGSLVSYYIGEYGGEPFLKKYGKYFFINHEDLRKTHEWFRKRGESTIFISRFIPVVRHLISIPAGIAKMNKKKFILYTFIGGLMWNSFLAYLGYLLGKKWELVHEYTKTLSYISAVLIIIGVIYFYVKHIKKVRKK